MGESRTWAVSELVTLARERLESAFGDVWVRGEVSNYKLAPSGHHYFLLKDAGAQLRAVMWRGRATTLKFRIEDGIELLARGRLTVYEARGEMQLSVEALEPAGAGALALAFAQLKQRLEAEGLFAPERKRALPLRPRRIAIVTSASGAALRDMLHVLGRRHASIPVLLAPVRVQGDGAAAEIAAAIDRVNRVADIDVVIVGRGGGSIEDLWAFNEEIVARAIARSRAPVISAVGHETDFTISDFVADLRAPTPSAAAEIVAGAANELGARVDAARRRLEGATRLNLAGLRARLDAARRSRSLLGVAELPRRHGQRLDDLEARLARAAARIVERARGRLQGASGRLAALDVRVRLLRDRDRLSAARGLLGERVRARLAERRAGFAEAAARLDTLSPLAVLGRGYALARRDDGRIVRRAADVMVGDRIHLKLAEGELACRVEERKP